MMDGIIAHAVNVVIGILIATLWQKIKTHKKEQDSIKLGVQSLLRGEITKSYYHYSEKGWIPLYALQSVEANYENYEALGANGVIDTIYNDLLSLPHTKPNEEKTGDSHEESL